MMATTAAQLLKQSLQEILVQASEAPLEADDYRDAIFVLNSWMAGLEADGVDLGYTPVDSLSDVITVPDGAIMGMVSNIAILIAPQYGRPISLELSNKAKKGMATIYRLGQTVAITEYPSTLPRGSGNTADGLWEDTFYPGAVDGNS
jgi:hypothetical protein